MSQRKPNNIKVTIFLSIATADMGAFMAAWDDEIKDKLCEQAGIDEAYIELPAEIKRIDLDTG